MADNGCVSLAERRPLPPLGHFALLRFRKQVAVTQAAPELVTAA
jgi:hypothetical protein